MSDQSWNNSWGSGAWLFLVLRHFFNGDLPSNNTTQNQTTPTKNACKPADFRQILQFSCEGTLLPVSFWDHFKIKFSYISLLG